MAHANDADIGIAVKAFNIGNKVKELRQKNHLTLQDLAAKTGLSKPFLSQIENNKVIPPVATLFRLARALEVALGHFFQEPGEDGRIAITRERERIRLDKRPHQEKGEVHYIYTALETKKSNKSMEPFLVEFPTQEKEEMVFMSHEGEEFLYVMEGQLEFRTVDRVEVLDPGDSIYIQSELSHSFRRVSEAPARALAVVCKRHIH